MASTNRFSSMIEECFNCCVCLELLESPRILPCGHSMCGPPRNCLSRLMNPNPELRRDNGEGEATFGCPFCDRRYPVGDGNVERFPVNFALMAGIENAKQLGTDRSCSKGFCSIHDRKQKDLYCRQCATILCCNCWHEHDETHVVIPFARYKNQQINQLEESCTEQFETTAGNIAALSEKMSKCVNDVTKHISTIENSYKSKFKMAIANQGSRITSCQSMEDLESLLEELRASAEKKIDVLQNIEFVMIQSGSPMIRLNKNITSCQELIATENEEPVAEDPTQQTRQILPDAPNEYQNLPKLGLRIFKSNVIEISGEEAQIMGPLWKSSSTSTGKIFLFGAESFYTLQIQDPLGLKMVSYVKWSETGHEPSLKVDFIAVCKDLLYVLLLNTDSKSATFGHKFVEVLDQSKFKCSRTLNLSSIPQTKYSILALFNNESSLFIMCSGAGQVTVQRYVYAIEDEVVKRRVDFDGIERIFIDDWYLHYNKVKDPQSYLAEFLPEAKDDQLFSKGRLVKRSQENAKSESLCSRIRASQLIIDGHSYLISVYLNEKSKQSSLQIGNMIKVFSGFSDEASFEVLNEEAFAGDKVLYFPRAIWRGNLLLCHKKKAGGSPNKCPREFFLLQFTK